MEIVRAEEADSDALQRVYLATWERTYRDIVPPAFFTRNLADRRGRDWSAVLRQTRAEGGDTLKASAEGDLIGFCRYGPSEDRELPSNTGEVWHLYVDPAHQRLGVGRSLLVAAGEGLRRAGMHWVVLWVVETNEDARRFYEHQGFQPDGGRRGHTAPQIRYCLQPDSRPPA